MRKLHVHCQNQFHNSFWAENPITRGWIYYNSSAYWLGLMSHGKSFFAKSVFSQSVCSLNMAHPTKRAFGNDCGNT